MLEEKRSMLDNFIFYVVYLPNTFNNLIKIMEKQIEKIAIEQMNSIRGGNNDSSNENGFWKWNETKKCWEWIVYAR